MLTENELIESCNISTEEIIVDINDTQKEIDDYKEINKILYRNPSDNRLKIYLNEGRILQREEVIKKLNKILEYRKSK